MEAAAAASDTDVVAVSNRGKQGKKTRKEGGEQKRELFMVTMESLEFDLELPLWFLEIKYVNIIMIPPLFNFIRIPPLSDTGNCILAHRSGLAAPFIGLATVCRLLGFGECSRAMRIVG